MNNPEFILVDEIETLVASVKTVLGIPVLNYQYGYIEELRQTLIQMEAPGFDLLKYPLVWFVEPFTETRESGDYYSDTSIELFIIHATDKTLKASERMAQVFKPVIFPIYRELVNQFTSAHHVFDIPVNTHLPHKKTNRYYWGEEQQKKIADVFDCMHISNLKLKIKNNRNCEAVSF